jgi:hypothetical protein
MKRQHHILVALLAALTLSVHGCSDDDDSNGNNSEAIDEHACEHIGQGTPVTAAAEEVDAGDVSSEHTGYLVALSDFEDGKGGYLTYQASAASDYGFFMSDDIPLQIFDSEGTEVAIEESGEGSGTCAITNYHLAELEVGTYTLVLGGADTSAGDVALTIEPIEHDHDHDDEDHDHEDEDHDHEDEDHDHDDHDDHEHHDDHQHE